MAHDESNKRAKSVFSGVQPSGDLHVGNYLGAIKQWISYQDTLNPAANSFFCIVDLHAITVDFSPEELQTRSKDLAAWFLAAGLDTDKVHIFLQSDNPDHPYLAWIFNCMTPMGWLERMTQFKEKSGKGAERASVGLFAYPNLMASDILLYDVDAVPVGEDQTQHVELARDIAKKFNNAYGDIFKVPELEIQRNVARVMSLQDPSKKMSKSDENKNGILNLNDDVDTNVKKIMRAVTDSGEDIGYGKDRPALSNLIALFSAFSGKSMDDIVSMYQGKGYGEFKKDLAEVAMLELEPLKKRHDEILADEGHIEKVLAEGAEKAQSISKKKISHVRDVLGLHI